MLALKVDENVIRTTTRCTSIPLDFG